jgi:tRNA (cmo5U34)-methyltransferase
MRQQSIDAYDLPERVASYDADMQLMHPNRAKMVRVALDAVPATRDAPLRALDLGTGTGYFATEFLHRFPNAQVWGVEGAPAMTELATARLGDLSNRLHFLIGDFRALAQLVPDKDSFDVVFSSFALHHLGKSDKIHTARQIHEVLKPSGWFFNADIIVASSLAIESRIQALRVAGIVLRAGGRDPRFTTADSTRAFLDDLESRDGDQPQTLDDDIEAWRSAGFRSVDVIWLEHREAVVAAVK